MICEDETDATALARRFQQLASSPTPKSKPVATISPDAGDFPFPATVVMQVRYQADSWSPSPQRHRRADPDPRPSPFSSSGLPPAPFPRWETRSSPAPVETSPSLPIPPKDASSGSWSTIRCERKPHSSRGADKLPTGSPKGEVTTTSMRHRPPTHLITSTFEIQHSKFHHRILVLE